MPSNQFSRGVAKIVTIAPETTWGVQSTAAGQQLRRTSCDLNLTTQEIQSAEILPSQQMRDSRQGPRSVSGTLAGQLSPLTYKLLMEGMLRSSFTAPAVVALNLSDAVVTVDGSTGFLSVSSPQNLFPATARLGDVVRLTGAPQAVNNQIYRLLSYTNTNVGLAAVLQPAVAMAAGQVGETLTIPGKRLIVPATGQLDQSYSIEQFYSDIGENELFVGCKMTQLGINIPSAGFATIQASVTGRDMISGSTTAYPGATAPTTTTGLTATNGQIGYAGTAISYIASASIQISSQVSADPAAGSNLIPGIFLGSLGVRGSITAFHAADRMTTDFLREREFSLHFLMTTDSSATADFVSVYLPRVKLTSSNKNDSDRAIMRSFNFTALENTGSVPGAAATTISIQDSAT